MGGKVKKKQTKKSNEQTSSIKKGKSIKKTVVTRTKKSEGKSKGVKSRFQVDIFNEDCMENAYFICHNVQDLLKWRGFPWPEAQAKKKKGKRR